MEKIIIGTTMGGMLSGGSYAEKDNQEIITLYLRMQVQRGILSKITVSDILWGDSEIHEMIGKESTSAERYGGTAGAEHPAGPHLQCSVDYPEICDIRADGIQEMEAGFGLVPEVRVPWEAVLGPTLLFRQATTSGGGNLTHVFQKTPPLGTG
jgi:hypothetical protein